MILVIDNYDSFVHNVARYFEVLGAATTVVRNDALDVAEIRRMRPDAIVVSPGPGTPAQAGISLQAIEQLTGHVPILGVCLGQQAIGAAFGGRVARAKEPMHGLSSQVEHRGSGLFAGLPRPMEVGRYHSLIVESTPGMEAELSVDAWSEAGEIMALSHRRHPTFGVQFHPESILTPEGRDLFSNFLELAADWARRHAMA